MKGFALIAAMLLGLAASVGIAAQPSLETGSVHEAAERLQAGEYLWAPEVAPEGPVLLIVSLATQRAIVYRNGLPIGITTVSTGRPGHRTPTGVFTVLQRRVEHYSNLYNNAPMPYMQRLTWGGVALHGGHLPGYPASHGCIRLPHEFARLLYGATHIGMTVVVTDQAAVPRIAPGHPLIRTGRTGAAGTTSWNPERAGSGPVSIVISAADHSLVVLRNGTIIGNAPASVDGPLERTSAFILHADAEGHRTWLRIGLPGQGGQPDEQLQGRIHVAPAFREAVQSVLEPGTTVVITSDSLNPAGTEQLSTVLESAGSNEIRSD